MEAQVVATILGVVAGIVLSLVFSLIARRLSRRVDEQLRNPQRLSARELDPYFNREYAVEGERASIPPAA